MTLYEFYLLCCFFALLLFFFFFKQKTAYEIRISDWSSDVCSSDLIDEPTLSIDDLMQYIPGPDFPTYGIINGSSGIIEAYRTGRGRILEIGRASCRERVCQYVWISVVAVSLKNNRTIETKVRTLSLKLDIDDSETKTNTI